MSRACSPWRRVAAPSIRIVPWAALASCWPLPQQLLPVSATGGGRSCCVAGWVESRGREGGVGTPLPASGPAERPCTLMASKSFPTKAQSFRARQRLPPRGSWQNRQVLTEGVKFFFSNVSFCIFFALRYKVSRTFLIFHRNVMTFFVKSGILYLAGTVGPQPLPRT